MAYPPRYPIPKTPRTRSRRPTDRVKLSPLCAAWVSELGALNKFVHIWPYKSIDERNATRDKAKAAGVWPPSLLAKKHNMPAYAMTAQENKILMPSAFSPIQ